MSEHPNDDEPESSTTEVYRVGEKRSVAEYANLDAEDESLARWKASLGISPATVTTSIGEPGDKRTVVILELALLFKEQTGTAKQPDVIIDLCKPDALSNLKKSPFVIFEDAEYRMRVKFRVQHDIISGLRYHQEVFRSLMRVDKTNQMMGSYGPNTKENPLYEKTFAEEKAPSGMIFRAKYTANGKFMDDDGKVHLQFDWAFEIVKAPSLKK